MSTYWDVRCLDCDATSGLHINHGDDTCRELTECRDALAMLADLDLPSLAEMSITVPGEYGHIDPSFYKTHARHALAAVSEYGHIDGDCNESRDGAYCRSAKGHEGDHDFHDASPWSPEWEAVRKRAAERRR
jgi:hypothetical protein